jgi:hypothetical protein
VVTVRNVCMDSSYRVQSISDEDELRTASQLPSVKQLATWILES